jgi:hypothetical protein
MVAEERRRLDEAESQYRQALAIFLELDDRHNAAIAYHQLGVTLAATANDLEAVRALLAAAVAWRQSTGDWPPDPLDLLRTERQHLSEEEFAAEVQQVEPPEMRGDLLTAIERPAQS